MIEFPPAHALATQLRQLTLDPERSASPQLRFRRFECKYLLTQAQANLTRRFLEGWVQPDPNAGRNNEYPISSLYLDTPDLQLFRETIEGNEDRFKLRIRSYADAPDAPVFLEIKKRRNRIVRKLRCRVSRRDFERLIITGSIELANRSPAEVETCEEFRTKMFARGAAPVVQIGYMREAWIGRDDPEVRVTFDRRLLSCATDSAQLRLPTSSWDTVEARRIVLELKFNDRCPAWMLQAIKAFSLVRTSYSKYTHAVTTSLTATRPSLAEG